MRMQLRSIVTSIVCLVLLKHGIINKGATCSGYPVSKGGGAGEDKGKVKAASLDAEGESAGYKGSQNTHHDWLELSLGPPGSKKGFELSEGTSSPPTSISFFQRSNQSNSPATHQQQSSSVPGPQVQQNPPLKQAERQTRTAEKGKGVAGAGIRSNTKLKGISIGVSKSSTRSTLMSTGTASKLRLKHSDPIRDFGLISFAERRHTEKGTVMRTKEWKTALRTKLKARADVHKSHPLHFTPPHKLWRDKEKKFLKLQMNNKRTKEYLEKEAKGEVGGYHNPLNLDVYNLPKVEIPATLPGKDGVVQDWVIKEKLHLLHNEATSSRGGSSRGASTRGARGALSKGAPPEGKEDAPSGNPAP